MSRLPSALRNQDGSVFIMVILATLVLTFLGLSLAFVTDTEMELGSNLQLIDRSYVAAESGLSAALAALMTTSDWTGEQFLINEGNIGSRDLALRVRTTPVQWVAFSDPPWSNSNWGERNFQSFFVSVSSTAQRVGYESTLSTAQVIDFSPNTQITVQTQQSATSAFLVSPLAVPKDRLIDLDQGNRDSP